MTLSLAVCTLDELLRRHFSSGANCCQQRVVMQFWSYDAAKQFRDDLDHTMKGLQRPLPPGFCNHAPEWFSSLRQSMSDLVSAASERRVETVLAPFLTTPWVAGINERGEESYLRYADKDETYGLSIDLCPYSREWLAPLRDQATTLPGQPHAVFETDAG